MCHTHSHLGLCSGHPLSSPSVTAWKFVHRLNYEPLSPKKMLKSWPLTPMNVTLFRNDFICRWSSLADIIRVGSNPAQLVSLWKGKLDRDKCAQKEGNVKTQERRRRPTSQAIPEATEAGRETWNRFFIATSKGTNPAKIFISDFWSPKLWDDNSCYFKATQFVVLEMIISVIFKPLFVVLHSGN